MPLLTNVACDAFSSSCSAHHA